MTRPTLKIAMLTRISKSPNSRALPATGAQHRAGIRSRARIHRSWFHPPELVSGIGSLPQVQQTARSESRADT